MTLRRKSGKRPRRNSTAHKRALKSQVVMDIIAHLRKAWKTMNGVARGHCLRVLVSHGCSARGLAKNLRQSPTTIRRQMELASLPVAQRRAVNAGASAKKILAAKAVSDRCRRARERINDDLRTGALSDELASIILEFCRGEGGLPPMRMVPDDLPMFFGCVATHLSEFEVYGKRGIRATKSMEIGELFRQARPPEDDDEDVFWMGYQSEWLANVILAKAPLRPIWESALKKAQKRAAELKVVDTRAPLEAYADNEARLVELRFGLNNRPIYPGGASRMLRQGRKPIS